MNRRSFIQRTGMSVAGLAAGALPVTRAFSNGFAAPRPRVAVATLRTYDRAAIRMAVEAMIDDLGGFPVSPGGTVGIKFNLTGGNSYAAAYQQQTGKHPGEAYWTHPEVLRAVGELARDAGAGKLYFLEAIYDQESYYQYGYSVIGDELGATFIDLNGKAPYSDYVKRPSGTGAFIFPDFTRNAVLDELDCLISVAKSKRHSSAGVTHGIKNLVGTLPLELYNDGEWVRMGIHRLSVLDGNNNSNLCRVVTDLAMATPIHLVVNDAIRTILGGEGPWQNTAPATFDTLVASKDPVAADAIATQALALDPAAGDFEGPFPASINYLKLASETGLGAYDPAAIEIVHSVTGIEENPDGPDRGLKEVDVYPVPFDDRLVVRLTLSTGAPVRIVIYDVMGKRIKILMDRLLSAGVHQVEWNGRDEAGMPVSAGAYLAQIQSTGNTRTKKLVRL